MLKYSRTVVSALKRRSAGSRSQRHYTCQYQISNQTGELQASSSSSLVLRRQLQSARYSTSASNDNGGGDQPPVRAKADKLEKILMRGYSPFLTKFFQLLPTDEQNTLRAFSDSLVGGSGSGKHLFQMYQSLKKHGLHMYLTIHALQRLMARIAADNGSLGDGPDGQASSAILGLIDDYGTIGFTPGTSEYTSLIRALAHESGREQEALQLLDDIVDRSGIAPFIRLSKKNANKARPAHERIPSDKEIARMERSLAEAEEKEQMLDAGDAKELAAQDCGIDSASGLDRIQQLVVDQRRQRQQQSAHGGDNGSSLLVSRRLYHAAMRGFAQLFHVRGVMAVLARMLEAATHVPFSVAQHLMPNKETWAIVGEVLVRQRDRPTFVRLWIDFMSRGARPPLSLTRSLVQMLARQACVEQAVWVMRISRCLPDAGDQLPMAPHARDHVPWALKVQTMHVASALDAATALDATLMTRDNALRQGRSAAQLPLLAPPDPDMYAQLIGGAVRAGNARLAEHLFAELVAAGVAPDGATYGHLARLYADTGRIERVFVIVRDFMVRRHHLAAREVLAQGHELTPHAQSELRAKLLRQGARLESDVECIVPLLQLYVQAGREQEALLLLRSWNRIYSRHVPAEKLALALLRVYTRPEDSHDAEGLVRRVLVRLGDGQTVGQTTDRPTGQTTDQPTGQPTDQPKPMHMYTELVKAHSRARNLPGILGVLREISARGMKPSHAVWELVMRSFLREQALDLFDTTHAYLRDTLSMPLSMPLYAMWMRALRNHGDVAGVQAAFDELLALGQIPTQQHYLYLVQAYAYNGWVERAVGIVDSLRKPYSLLRPGLNLNIAVIEAHVACGNMEQAEAELHYLLSNTPLPKSSIPARPFNYLIIGHLYAGSGRKAMHVYEDMIRLGIKPDAYTFAVLMHSYALAKDLENCMRVFNEMIRIGIAPDLAIYTILICAFGAARKVGSAELVFNQVAQEQDLSRSASSPAARAAADALDIYAEDPARADWPSLMDTPLSAEDDPASERLRAQSFFNLDPIVYIAMLKVYNNAHKPMRALATWDRFIKNFPVVQWNPRKGGVLSKSLHYTAQFHLPAWTLLLRTIKLSIGVQRVLKRPSTMPNYFHMPLYPGDIARVMARRLDHKNLISRMAALRADSGAGAVVPSPAACAPASRMAYRTDLVGDLEAELDERTFLDHEWCVRQRYMQPKPVFDEDNAFSDFVYWMPDTPPQHDPAYLDSAARFNDSGSDLEASEPNSESALASLFDSDGNFTTKSTREIAAIVARQWRDLESAGFKFNNIHVSVYVPCMLLGRQYTDLARFLSLVEPKSETNATDFTNHNDSTTGYRYHNINIAPYLTAMMVRQAKVIRRLLVTARDRRIILDALLNEGSQLRFDYLSTTKLDPADVERSADVRQVMRERRAIHAEREISWTLELAMLKDVAVQWRRHTDDEPLQLGIDQAIESINRTIW